MVKSSSKQRGRKDPLVGRYFHSLNAQSKIHWQGTVLARPKPGLYLVQLFEWGFGEPNVQRLVRIEDMHDWLFYDNSEAMIESYDHGIAREGGPYRDRDQIRADRMSLPFKTLPDGLR